MNNDADQGNILIVDDNIGNLRLLTNMLKGRGFKTRAVSSGSMALTAARTAPPELFLLDIMMPEMSGYELCQNLKSDEQTRDIPIIFISALNDVTDKVKAFAIGGLDYITKPFQEEEVFSRVQTHLNLYRLKRTLEDQNAQLRNEIELRTKTEALLKNAREEAERANRAKSSFLANVSHEIRTPLNAIIGFLTLSLQDDSLSKHLYNYLNTALISSKSLLNLINDILDISKLESGKIDLELKPFNLSKIIQESLETVEIKAREKGLTIDFRIASDLPQFFIGDCERLKQIMINLTGNAVKFTEKGKIAVQIERESNEARRKKENSNTSEGNDREKICLHFSVSDTGIGIAHNHLDQIFYPFVQADSSIAKKYGGTGLGTTISKQLIELMGGQIWVESQLSSGSTFHFTLPLKPTDNIAELLSANHTEKILPSVNPFKNSFRILLAEDVPFNVTLAKINLEKEGHSVMVAVNGREAIEIFRREPDIDLILMDVFMPEMDGLEATRQIREYESVSPKTEAHRIPIIALTAGMMQEEKKACIDAGMDHVIGKPINFLELSNTMKFFVNRSGNTL